MVTYLARPVPPFYFKTYYFKTTVTMSSTACYSGLFLDMVVNDGLVLYLNNVENPSQHRPGGGSLGMTLRYYCAPRCTTLFLLCSRKGRVESSTELLSL